MGWFDNARSEFDRRSKEIDSIRSERRTTTDSYGSSWTNGRRDPSSSERDSSGRSSSRSSSSSRIVKRQSSHTSHDVRRTGRYLLQFGNSGKISMREIRSKLRTDTEVFGLNHADGRDMAEKVSGRIGLRDFYGKGVPELYILEFSVGGNNNSGGDFGITSDFYRNRDDIFLTKATVKDASKYEWGGEIKGSVGTIWFGKEGKDMNFYTKGQAPTLHIPSSANHWTGTLCGIAKNRHKRPFPNYETKYVAR